MERGGPGSPTSEGRTETGGEQRLTLLVAVQRQDAGLVQRLIAEKVRSKRDKSGRSELHALAEGQTGPFPPPPPTRTWAPQSSLECMPSVMLWKQLMVAGASPSRGDRDGVTPLHLACARGNWPVVFFLVQGRHVGNVDVADENGETPLHYAARSGSEAIVVMLSRKANTLVAGKNGTADQVAARAGHERLAEWMAKWNFAACPLLTLPSDLLVSIMEWLEPYDLCSVAQTCSILNEASSTDCVWQQYCSPRWPRMKSQEGQWWKERYLLWRQTQLKRYGQAPRDRVGIGIVGEPGVGKAALLHRFLRDDFTMEDDVFATAIAGNKTVEVDGRRINVQAYVWASAKEDLRLQRPLPGRREIGGDGGGKHTQGLAILYDITSRASFVSLAPFVTELRRRYDTPMPTFVLVGTKRDMSGWRQVTAKEGQALATELGALSWFEVSSLQGTGDPLVVMENLPRERIFVRGSFGDH